MALIRKVLLPLHITLTGTNALVHFVVSHAVINDEIIFVSELKSD